MRFDVTTKDKYTVFQHACDYLTSQGFKIVLIDVLKPWGFFIYIDPDQTEKFIAEFYKGQKLKGIDTSLPLQPKIMAVEDGKQLSWQYHMRRSEIWRIIEGSLLVVTSKTDHETAPKSLKAGDVITLTQGLRHRTSGHNEWGIFAELWQHTDPDNPSDENDAIRLQDDYDRK